MAAIFCCDENVSHRDGRNVAKFLTTFRIYLDLAWLFEDKIHFTTTIQLFQPEDDRREIQLKYNVGSNSRKNNNYIHLN
tara:strand:- start:4610 stop:4846 length:237 start_codon:yes stop_codon:yes gene_type:complete